MENCWAVFEGLNSLNIFSNDVEEMMDASLTKCSGDNEL